MSRPVSHIPKEKNTGILIKSWTYAQTCKQLRNHEPFNCSYTKLNQPTLTTKQQIWEKYVTIKFAGTTMYPVTLSLTCFHCLRANAASGWARIYARGLKKNTKRSHVGFEPIPQGNLDILYDS